MDQRRKKGLGLGTFFFVLLILFVFPVSGSCETKAYYYTHVQPLFWEERWHDTVIVASARAKHGLCEILQKLLKGSATTQEMQPDEDQILAFAKMQLNPKIVFDGETGPDGTSFLMVTAKVNLDMNAFAKNLSAFLYQTFYLDRFVENAKHEKELLSQFEGQEKMIRQRKEILLYERGRWMEKFRTFSQRLKAVDLNEKALKALLAAGDGPFAGNAMKYLDAAISLYPDWAELYYNRGFVHYKNLSVKAHLDDLEKVLQLDPSFAPAYEDRAMCHMLLEHCGPAWSDARKACEMGDCDALILFEAMNAIFGTCE